jgi:ammonium transporter Rh
MPSIPNADIEVPPPPPEEDDADDLGSIGVALTPMKSGGMSPRSPETQEAFDRIEQMERNMEKRLQEATMRMSVRQDEVVAKARQGDVPPSVLMLVVWQIGMLVCFGLACDYSHTLFDGIDTAASTGGNAATAAANNAAAAAGMLNYGHFQDVHVMIFIGFGFLMTFLRKYGLSAVSLNMLVSVFAIQWHILAGSFIHMLFAGDVHTIMIDLNKFITGDFCAAVILITFGALIGKVNFQQLLVICFFEVLFFSCNESINTQYFKTSDMGGSVVVHTFGAYFGLACSWVLSPRDAETNRMNNKIDTSDNAPSYNSDIFAMIGTIFLFMFWPSFNSALAPVNEQQRTVVNTLLSITASAATAFISSYYAHGNKFNMVDVQNATLAGGVAIGTASSMAVSPGGCVAVGCIAGVLSVVGYTQITPYLEESIGLYDTCGVHNLHGMPGVLAGIAGAITAASATTDHYQSSAGTTSSGLLNLQSAFGGRYTSAGAEDRTAGQQAGWQAAFLAFTLLTSIVTGVITGYIAKQIASPQKLFTDETDIDCEEYPDGCDTIPDWYKDRHPEAKEE